MRLRVIDCGTVVPSTAQAVYHGLAENLQADDEPILVLVNPNAPFVWIGLHQNIEDDVDEAFCRRRGLPIYRRHLGGGTVLVDRNQMFFQYVLPYRWASERAERLFPRFAEPAVRTYRRLGVGAEFRPPNDIQVDGRKIGGTAAAHIGEATAVVGSFMFDFDTDTMAQCLAAPSEEFRRTLKASLDAHMTWMARLLSTVPDRETVKSVFLRELSDVLGVDVVEDRLTVGEAAAAVRAERELTDPDFIYRPTRRRTDDGIKIAEGKILRRPVART
jgi:lipoate-protein ligase A